MRIQFISPPGNNILFPAGTARQVRRSARSSSPVVSESLTIFKTVSITWIRLRGCLSVSTLRSSSKSCGYRAGEVIVKTQIFISSSACLYRKYRLCSPGTQRGLGLIDTGLVKATFLGSNDTVLKFVPGTGKNSLRLTAKPVCL